MTPGTLGFGPRELNDAITSPFAAAVFSTRPVMRAVWFVPPPASHALSATPSSNEMCTAGRACMSAVSESPLAASLTSTMPTPPAFFTSWPFATRP